MQKLRAISYTADVLFAIKKSSSMIPTEKLSTNVQGFPLESYKKFYNNQFKSDDNNEIIVKILADINTRLDSPHILNLHLFHEYKKLLENIKEKCISILVEKQGTSDLNILYSTVIEYVETMHTILKSRDNKLIATYHTNFAKDFLKDLCKIGHNTKLFFTYNKVNHQYLIDIRPCCLYQVQLIDLPDFSSSVGPLIPTKHLMSSVEGKLLDFREITFHDLGHSHIMNRQDQWLFQTLNRNPVELVAEWIRNKNCYVDEYTKLRDVNYNLYKAIQLYLFDIVHDRGY